MAARLRKPEVAAENPGPLSLRRTGRFPTGDDRHVEDLHEPAERKLFLPWTRRATDVAARLAHRWRPRAGSDRGKRLVLAEHRPHRAADLAQRAVCVNRVDDRGHHVLVALGRLAQAGERTLR